ncbi:MAG: phospholipase A [Proteobacteria bacterium]|nr:phospholipase A [Pseudomonadota bacterium]
MIKTSRFTARPWTRSIALHLVGLAAATLTADAAADEGCGGTDPALPLGLQSYEPSAFGYMKQSDDVGTYNIKISVKFPLAPQRTCRLWGDQNRLYFAFTGYWDFYIGSRHSSPVVGKEYSPQLFWQHYLPARRADEFHALPSYGEGSAGHAPAGRHDYWALGYAHDSNGQSIDSLAQFQEAQRSQGDEAARDALSRGWDYAFVNAKFTLHSDESHRLTVYPSLRYFLPRGLLQGRAEELHDWERPADGKLRKAVDGLALLGKFQWTTRSDPDGFGDAKIALRYATGYQDPFRHSTLRVEAGLQVLQLPIVLWAQNGYLSDLAQYYRRVSAYGIELEIGAF